MLDKSCPFDNMRILKSALKNMGRLKLKRIARNAWYAIEGLVTFLKEEFSARVQIVLDVAAIILGIVLNINKTEWMLILFTIFLAWAVEAINSSIERLVDLTTKEHHPLAKQAKDLAASASLFVFFIAAMLTVTIFVPRIADRV